MKREHADFQTLPEADAFADAREAEGFESVSIITNTPRVGMYQVRWGHEDAQLYGHAEEMADLARIARERQRPLDEAFEARCLSVGLQEVAEAAATQAGYTGREHEVFVGGATGQPRWWINPRDDGTEPIFREGRQLRADAAFWKAVRASAARARSHMWREYAEPVRFGAFITNGEQYG